MTAPTMLAMNLTGVIEAPGMDSVPYLIGADGRPYLPIGDGGVVLGVALGDSVFGFDAEHASPAVTLVHSDQAARHALTAFGCLGNPVTVRSGAAAGEVGTVLGKRGEAGQLLVWFPPEVLARLTPGDSMVIRAFGQGATLPAGLARQGARLLNVAPALLARLPVTLADGAVECAVRGAVASKLIGNGIGRPAQQWSLDLQVDSGAAPLWELSRLAVGDLIAVHNLDVRHNAGYRFGWSTVGVTVTTASPRPGNGPQVMPILCLPTASLALTVRPVDHVGVTAAMLAAG